MSTGAKRVLIIDPHEDVLIAVEKLLEDAGFDTRTAWCGPDALSSIRRERFDVVLISEYLPDCGCETVLNEIGRRNKGVRCFVMQAFAPSMADNRFADLGASGVVCKHDLAAIKHLVMDAVRELRRPETLRAAG